jgi:flagellar assembly protein FliH
MTEKRRTEFDQQTPGVQVYEYFEASCANAQAGSRDALAEPSPWKGAGYAPYEPIDLFGGAPLTDEEETDAEDSPSPAESREQEETDLLIAAECRRWEERGHSRGMEAGLGLGRAEASAQLEEERNRLYSQAAALASSFAESRDRYLHQLENETAELALAIAARILRREAQMDPLLLTGAVRVALGQLAASTSVRLRVPLADQSFWEEALSLLPGLAIRPQVVGDDRLALGECVMETELGSADLGLWPQLKEIERGFFDRIGDRRGKEAAEENTRVEVLSAENPESLSLENALMDSESSAAGERLAAVGDAR